MKTINRTKHQTTTHPETSGGVPSEPLSTTNISTGANILLLLALLNVSDANINNYQPSQPVKSPHALVVPAPSHINNREIHAGNRYNYEHKHTQERTEQELADTLEGDAFTQAFEAFMLQLTPQDIAQVEADADKIVAELHPQIMEAGFNVSLSRSMKAILVLIGLIGLWWLLYKKSEAMQDAVNNTIRFGVNVTMILAVIGGIFIILPELQDIIPFHIGRPIKEFVSETGDERRKVTKKHGGGAIKDIYTEPDLPNLHILIAVIVAIIGYSLLLKKRKWPIKIIGTIILGGLGYFGLDVFNSAVDIGQAGGEATGITIDPSKLPQAAQDSLVMEEQGKQFAQNALSGKESITYQDTAIANIITWCVQHCPPEDERSFNYKRNISVPGSDSVFMITNNVYYSVNVTGSVVTVYGRIGSDKNTGLMNITNKVVAGHKFLDFAFVGYTTGNGTLKGGYRVGSGNEGEIWSKTGDKERRSNIEATNLLTGEEIVKHWQHMIATQK